MVALLISSGIALMYALIRAKHDSFILQGKWKKYAFIEGVFFAILTVIGLKWGLTLSWLSTPFLALSFALSFSIPFDMACGVHWGGSVWYLGSGSWDRKVNAIFKGGKGWAIFKFVWLIIVSGVFLETL